MITSRQRNHVLLLVLSAAIITIGTSISNIDAQKSDFKKYENTDYNIKIDYPSKWKKSGTASVENSVVFPFLTHRAMVRWQDRMKAIVDKIASTSMSAEDEYVITMLLKEGLNQRKQVHQAMLLYALLSKKRDKTLIDKMTLKKIKPILAHEIKVTKQAAKIMDLIKQCKKNRNMDSNVVRKIMKENNAGFWELANRPEHRALRHWFRKYEQPKRFEYREAINKKLPEAAFGSEKYPRYYSDVITKD
jgi:predicted restriction endonuclease